MRLFIALLLLAPAAAAQTPAPQNSLAAYQAARLYIEGQETITTNQGGRVLDTRRTWNALQGDRKISEAQFYETVGRDDLAAAAQQRAGRARTARVGSYIAAVIGTGAAVIGGVQYINSDSEGLEIGETDNEGFVLLMTGFTVGTAGMLGVLWTDRYAEKRETHVQAAAEMAAVYNADLDRQRSEAEADNGIRDTAPRP